MADKKQKSTTGVNGRQSYARQQEGEDGMPIKTLKSTRDAIIRKLNRKEITYGEAIKMLNMANNAVSTDRRKEKDK